MHRFEEFQGRPALRYAAARRMEKTCVGCHMQTIGSTDTSLTQAGGHTFKPSWTDGTNKVELVGACQTCHGTDVTTFDFALFDYDNDGVIEGVQTEVQHLLDKLSSMLPPNSKQRQRGAVEYQASSY